MAIPICLGLFFKRTPGWSTWTTALIGLVVAWLVKFQLKPEDVAFLPGMAGPFLKEEITNFYIFATVISVSVVGIGWFFFTSLFYERSSPAYRASVEEFFGRLRTPYGGFAGEAVKENRGFVVTIGRLSMIYGGFIMLFALIPNSLGGRLCFLIGGGAIAGIGFFLARRRSPITAAVGCEAAAPACQTLG
jgi:SSS family solute:Na+ symporter